MHPAPDVVEGAAGHGLDRPTRSAYRALLPPEVAAAWPDTAGPVRAVWTGVVWSRLGRCDQAWAWWAAVADVVDRPAGSARERLEPVAPEGLEPGASARRLGPWVAAERGRCLRELGLHGAARDVEAPVLIAATDPVDAAMLRISLAADAVGLARAEQARTLLDAARRAVGALADGPRAARQRLRLAWVDVEVALLTGEVPPSAGLPRWDDATDSPQLPPDHAHGSRFHAAKGLLFGAVVHDDARLLRAAAAEAPPMLRWAVLLAVADRGERGAMDAARDAWRLVVAPPGWASHVATTATARRLA